MITSTSNPKIKHVCQLIKSSSDRRKEGLFVVEGMRICGEVPSEKIVEAYISESCLDKCRQDGKGPGTDGFVLNAAGYEVVSDAVFKKMSDTVTGQGVLCVVRQDRISADEYVQNDSVNRLLILENIQDPGNLGTMIRTAEAAGFDGIITDQNTVDVYNPKVIRSTMGGIFRMPVVVANDFGILLNKLKDKKYTLYAALLDGAEDYRKIQYKGKVGILIGNEGNGLTKETAKMSDVHVRIPMEGKVESLNAAVAAALMMYEVVR